MWREFRRVLFRSLGDKVKDYLSHEPTLYVVDAFAGADPAHRIAVRVVTTHPYHALFARTMFIDPTPAARGRLRGGPAPPVPPGVAAQFFHPPAAGGGAGLPPGGPGRGSGR